MKTAIRTWEMDIGRTVYRKPPTKEARHTLPLLEIKDPHSTLWDSDPEEMLSAMAGIAGYPEESRAIHRAFFANSVASSLGPHPAGTGGGASSWQSFMTDDRMPLELSWSWSATRAKPAVRFSAEPVGWAAGTPSDPFNTLATVELLGETLPLAPSLDLSWHSYFLKALTVSAAVD
jgi:DMATS type aromatic prenyltransferase